MSGPNVDKCFAHGRRLEDGAVADMQSSGLCGESSCETSGSVRRRLFGRMRSVQ